MKKKIKQLIFCPHILVKNLTFKRDW